MDQPDQPHDMQRDASPSEHYPKGAPPPLPQEYGWPNDIDHPPACCWHCKCFFLCCGGCCDEAQLPLGVRIVDFIAANMFWWTGMYVGGNYNRDRLERLMNRTAVPAGIDKINGVRSWDSYVQSSVDPGYRIRVRIFASTQQPSTPKKPSVMVYFHGGGWCMSHPDLPSFHNLGIEFAKAGYVVVSVDYRLAPEHPFPAALFDCFDVCRWVASKPPSEPIFEELDVSRLTLGGDSAGGNLATVIATLVRDGLGPDLQPPGQSDPGFSVRQLLLIYPALMMRRFVNEPAPANAPFLSKPVSTFFFASYVPGSSMQEKQHNVQTERRLCPILAGFHNLPRCIMVSGGTDFLRFENATAVDAMKQAGTEVVYRTVPRQPHGFLAIVNYEPAKHCIRQMVADLREGEEAMVGA